MHNSSLPSSGGGAPTALLALIDAGDDDLVSEMAVRALARSWMDPFVDIDSKVLVSLMGSVTATSTPRSVVLQALRSLTQVVQTRQHPDLLAMLSKAALDRTTDPRGSVRALAVQTLCTVCTVAMAEEAHLQTGLAEVCCCNPSCVGSETISR